MGFSEKKLAKWRNMGGILKNSGPSPSPAEGRKMDLRRNSKTLGQMRLGWRPPLFFYNALNTSILK